MVEFQDVFREYLGSGVKITTALIVGIITTMYYEYRSVKDDVRKNREYIADIRTDVGQLKESNKHVTEDVQELKAMLTQVLAKQEERRNKYKK